MGKLPVLNPKEVIHSLEKLGFVEVRQRGSHKQFRHLDGRETTVPVHSGKARQAGKAMVHAKPKRRRGKSSKIKEQNWYAIKLNSPTEKLGIA